MGRIASNIFIHLQLSLLLVSCIAQQGASSSRQVDGVTNGPTRVGPYQSYVMPLSPSDVSGDNNLSINISLSNYLDSTAQLITTNQTLYDSLAITTSQNSSPMQLDNIRFSVRQTSQSSYLGQNQGTWAYDANSDEFQEVNTFYLLKKEITYFQEALWNQSLLNMNGTSFSSDFALNTGYWSYQLNTSTMLKTPLTLQAFTKGYDAVNAAFSPATFELLFGFDESLKGQYLSALYFTQDPSVVFHETGHAMIHLMMNSRNLSKNNTVTTQLGYRFYDEAGAINEGLADYFSYAMTGKTHFAQWSLGTFYRASRPICEDDYLHIAGISEDPSERLRYPDFLNYDPNESTKIFEDIHNAGMITSHYLVALTKQLESECGFTHESATKAILGLLAETMMKLGDLSATGKDGQIDFINLDSTNAMEWIQTVNPINYRRFFQTFALKLLYYLQHQQSFGMCTTITQDNVEQLLDSYGLLLFRSYNDDGNNDGSSNVVTQVNDLNRQYSQLVKKEHVILDPTPDATTAYVFDDQPTIANIINSYTSTGIITSNDLAPISLIPADYSYNNGNGKISPGELVGVSLNLYNDSNTPIAGVQLLANDWDHAKDGKPCRQFEKTEDSWPTDSEGAALTTNETGVPGDCKYTTRHNSNTAPVCFLQLNKDNSTQWVSQEEFRRDRGLEPIKCLGGENKTDDCYIRAVKHLSLATYSKIDSHKTWAQTMTALGQPLNFNESELIFFEVSPWVPPGTKVNCRLRARFTNCDDCYNRQKTGKTSSLDSTTTTIYDDYDDYEYSGALPFQIINFQFTIID